MQRDKAEGGMPAHQMIVHRLGRGGWVQREIWRCEDGEGDGDKRSLAGAGSRTERSGACCQEVPAALLE